MGLTVTESATDAGIQKKICGSGTALIISNEEMNDIMKIAKYLIESGLLIIVISKTNNKKVHFSACY